MELDRVGRGRVPAFVAGTPSRMCCWWVARRARLRHARTGPTERRHHRPTPSTDHIWSGCRCCSRLVASVCARRPSNDGNRRSASFTGRDLMAIAVASTREPRVATVTMVVAQAGRSWTAPRRARSRVAASASLWHGHGGLVPPALLPACDSTLPQPHRDGVIVLLLSSRDRRVVRLMVQSRLAAAGRPATRDGPNPPTRRPGKRSSPGCARPATTDTASGCRR
jgi:hypothetical protein